MAIWVCDSRLRDHKLQFITKLINLYSLKTTPQSEYCRDLRRQIWNQIVFLKKSSPRKNLNVCAEYYIGGSAGQSSETGAGKTGRIQESAYYSAHWSSYFRAHIGVRFRAHIGGHSERTVNAQ